ncbi:MAG: hypothetical protein IAX21_05805 [Candidatus Bathyarchaeota archaeon]|nr:MAG: hypothetical protein IAX21_05805 [Candidatus Bathyarchaeota archaeon]
MPTEPILQLLENGEWHYLKDIPKQTALNNITVKYITKFLTKYKFVKLDQTKQKIKLDLPTTVFFNKIRQIENEESVKTLKL